MKIVANQEMDSGDEKDSNDEENEDGNEEFWSEDDEVPLYKLKTYANMNDDVDGLPLHKRLRRTNAKNNEEAIADDCFLK